MQIRKIQDQGHDIGSVFSVAQIGAHAMFMLALIAGICGDMGMCVVYTIIFAVMAWSAGVKVRWFVLVGGALAIAFVVLWFFVLPKTEAWDDLYPVSYTHLQRSQGIDLELAPEALRQQSAWGVARAAVACIQAGTLVKGKDLVPVYHRLSQAERERLERQGRSTQE